MPQTTYTNKPVQALVAGTVFGNLARCAFDSGILTTAAGAEAGRLLTFDSPNGTAQEEKVKVLSAAGDVNRLAGVGVYPWTTEPKSPSYAQDDEVPLLRRGRMWVTSYGDTTALQGKAPFIVFSGTHAGQIAPDDGTLEGAAGTAAQGPISVQVIVGATDGNLALIDLNLP